MPAPVQKPNHLSQYTQGDPDILLTLLSDCFPQPASSGKHYLSDDALLQVLHRLQQHGYQNDNLAQAVSEQLEPAEKLAAKHFAQLRFIDSLLQGFLNTCQLAPEIIALIKPLAPLMASCQLRNAHWSWDWNHPLNTTFALLQNHLLGWSAGQGKAAERTLSTVQEHLHSLATSPYEQLAAAVETLRHHLESEQQRLQKMEQRLRDAEHGAMQARRHQQQVRSLLNEKMLGKQLPIEISRFLQGPWQDSLKLQLINQSVGNEQWQRLGKLTQTLIWSFQPAPADNNEHQQRLYHLVPELQDELAKQTVSLTHQHSELSRWLSDIEQLHLALMKGQRLTYAPFKQLAQDDPLADSSTTISSHLLKPVTTLSEGSWLEISDNHGSQRVKLLLKLNDVQQLLFVYRHGAKAGQYSFEEFAYRLSSGHAKVIISADRISKTANYVVKKLALHRDQKNELAARQRAEAEAKAKAEAEAKERARQKALAEAQALAKAKAEQKARLEHAAKLAEQRRREQVAAQAAADHQARLESAQQQTSALNTGALINFYDEQGSAQLCKLAVKIQSSQKYIFVDRNGIKSRELYYDQLVDQFMQSSAELVKAEAGFEDALAKVVNSLRKS